MTFNTEYELKEFREIQNEHFDCEGKVYAGLGNQHRLAEKMLKLINLLEAEIDRLTAEKEGDKTMITDEQKIILTEWLGEEWYGITELNRYLRERNRTFDNWNDFGAVVEKLEETKQWIKFCNHLERLQRKRVKQTGNVNEPTFFLKDKERFCILVADAIREGVIKW